jgi:hypothetical protein
VALPASTVKVATKNFFAPLQTNTMGTDALDTKSTTTEKAVKEKSGRLPPIMLTSANNLIQLQKQLKGVAKDTFEFRSTINGTRVVTKNMMDYQSVKTYFESKNLPYYIFYPKSEKPIKAVISHLPINTPAEDIAEGPVDLGFDVISVKQVTTAHRSLEGTIHITLPLFLATLPRTTKSKDLFKLSNLCHISIKVESYKSQNALMQCYNCQKCGPTANNLPAVCGVGAATCIETVWRKRIHLQHRHAATASWLKERQHLLPTTAAASMLRNEGKEARGNTKTHNWKGVHNQIQ